MIMPSNTKIHVSTRSALAAEINARWHLFANFGDQTAESERRKLSSTPYALVNPYRRTWLPSTSKRQVTVIVTAFSGPVALPERVRKQRRSPIGVGTAKILAESTNDIREWKNFASQLQQPGWLTSINPFTSSQSSLKMRKSLQPARWEAGSCPPAMLPAFVASHSLAVFS